MNAYHRKYFNFSHNTAICILNTRRLAGNTNSIVYFENGGH
jgi:hypothetical protein